MAKPWPKTGDEVKEAGYKSSGQGYCKGCDKQIVWVKTPEGKNMPLSHMDDGRWQPHWADCEARDQFSRRKKA